MLSQSGDELPTIYFVAAALRDIAGIAADIQQLQMGFSQSFRQTAEQRHEGNLVSILKH
jgi:hypothetical protein